MPFWADAAAIGLLLALSYPDTTPLCLGLRCSDLQGAGWAGSDPLAYCRVTRTLLLNDQAPIYILRQGKHLLPPLTPGRDNLDSTPPASVWLCYPVYAPVLVSAEVLWLLSPGGSDLCSI